MFVKAILLFLLPSVIAQNCKDDPNFKWRFEWEDETLVHSCAFLTNSNNEAQNEKRQKNWCNQKVGYTNVLIKNKCLKSCDNCPVDSPVCIDSPKLWKDNFGNNCEWYEGGDGVSRCARWGHRRMVNGRVANDVCCVCGGGKEVYYNDDEKPNDPTCTDSPRYWKDNYGNDCEWYEGGDGVSRCARWGHRRMVNGRVANDVCCVCGGGRYSSLVDTIGVAEEITIEA